MNSSRTTFLSFCLAILLISLAQFAGCSGNKTASEPEEAPTSMPTRMKKVDIDEVLARNDYSQAAREKFEHWKKIGRKMVLEKEVSDAIRLSMIKEPVTMEATTRMRIGRSRQPTLSILKNPPPSKYPRRPTNAADLLEGEANYVRLGVEHFKKRAIFALKDEDRKAVVEYMNSVIDGPEAEFNKDVWDEIGRVGADLAERLTPQLKNEPMFNLCLAINERQVGMLASSTMRLDHALEHFASSEYPTRLPIYSIRILDSKRSERRSRTSYDDRIAAMKHWITKDFRARGIDERFALKDVDKFLNLAFMNRDLPALQEFVYCVETSDTLPKWFQSMALAEYYSDLGYYYRGTGYADTVTKEGWEKLEEYSKTAHQYYEEALEENPNYPEAAAGLMAISRLGYSDKPEEYWFKKAIEHEVDYMPVYRSRLLALMPRWGGSVDKMIAFATEHANKKDYKTGVPFILPQCVFMLRDAGVLDRNEYDKLTSDPKLLEDMTTALEGLAKHNKQNIFRSEVQDSKFIPTLLALYLTRAGEVDRAERVYRTLGNQHSPMAVKLYGVGAAGSLDALSATATAMNAEYGIEAKQLQELMVETVAGRIENYDAIKELVGNISLSDESGGLFFSRALKQVEQEKSFAEGNVVSIDFDQQMNMWTMADNRQLKHVSATAATFDNSSGDRHNAIRYNGTFPGPRVTEMTFTFPDKAMPNPMFAPGFVAATYQGFHYTFGIGIAGSKESRLIGRPANPDEVCTAQIIFGATNGEVPTAIFVPYRNNCIKLQVYTDKNWFEVYADDQYVFSYRNTAVSNLYSGFAIQMIRSVNGTGQVEVSDINIQQWSGAPPETRRPAKLVDHYKKKYDADPDDKWNQFWLAHALHNDDKTEEALKLYEKAVESGVNKQLAGFYIGDILDRQGKRQEAFEWYLESSLGLSDGGTKNLMYAHNPNRAINGPLNWSCFRAYWLHETCGFELSINHKSKLSNWAKIPGELEWLSRCRHNLKTKGEHENTVAIRIKSLKTIVEKTPQRYKHIATEIKDAVETEGAYEVSTKEDPVYLKVKEATPFFRSIEKVR